MKKYLSIALLIIIALTQQLFAIDTEKQPNAINQSKILSIGCDLAHVLAIGLIPTAGMLSATEREDGPSPLYPIETVFYGTWITSIALASYCSHMGYKIPSERKKESVRQLAR